MLQRARISFRSSIAVLSVLVLTLLADFVFIGVFKREHIIDRVEFAAQAVMFSIGSVAVIVSLILCRHWLLSLAPQIDSIVFAEAQGEGAKPEKWYRQNIAFFDFTFGNIALGMFVGIGATTSYYSMSYIGAEDRLVSQLGYAAIFLSAFVAGTALYTLGRGVKFFNRLGRNFGFHLSSHQFGVLLIGRVLIKCYLVIVLTVAFFQSTTFVSGGDFYSNFNSLPMLVLGYPVSIFLLFCFVYSQSAIHEKLREAKILRIREIEVKIRETGIPGQDDSGEKIELLTYLYDDLRRNLQIPEWPCDLRGFVSGGSISVLGLIFPTLIDSGFQTVLKLISGAS